ncbi:hypothetical protein ASJ81_17405 [Methanosarcina spelaei]|uniref:Uncharacterized protein n=1 Tax=Methanosarcina spelaei TaxID=1036679 RepID=A0A2A2HVM8_9EURY|nr:hypothetical protein ASJ81_17405 [Methanosarcina spelaei]
MNRHYFSLDNYYKYFVGLDGIILTFLIIKSYPTVVNLATKSSFFIMLVGSFCVFIDNWNRKSIKYRLYVELYENEYQAISDYKAGKVFINLIFYVISIYLVFGLFGTF